MYVSNERLFLGLWPQVYTIWGRCLEAFPRVRRLSCVCVCVCVWMNTWSSGFGLRSIPPGADVWELLPVYDDCQIYVHIGLRHMDMHANTHIHTCTHTHIQAYTHAHIHAYTHTHIHTHTHTSPPPPTPSDFLAALTCFCRETARFPGKMRVVIAIYQSKCHFTASSSATLTIPPSPVCMYICMYVCMYVCS